MKVIIHLGFPKTASSTMQFGPLLELEQQGGVTLSTWRKSDPSEPLEDRPSSRLFLGKPILPEYLQFSKSCLNVLSDESFTAPLRLRRCNFDGELTNPLLFPKLIRDQITALFSDVCVEFCWVATIRNQRDLIQSQYVEEYNWKRYRGRDLLFDKDGEVDLTGYEVYRYSDYIASLNEMSSKYGDKIRLFLYEDMRDDPAVIFDDFDLMFDAPRGFFETSFKRNHVNGKQKSVHGTFTKDGDYFVPRLPASVGDKIAEGYYQSNAELEQFFSVEKLRSYGYVRP